MVYHVQFLAEGEVPPFDPFATTPLEEKVSEASLYVWRAFNQAHELVRFVLDLIARNEDFPRIMDALRHLRVWHGRAFQMMELVGNELRASSFDTCAHDAALRFAGQAAGAFTMAGHTQKDEYLSRLHLPDLLTMNDRLKVESARTLERLRPKETNQKRTEQADWMHEFGSQPPGEFFSDKWLTGTKTEIGFALRAANLPKVGDRQLLNSFNKMASRKRSRVWCRETLTDQLDVFLRRHVPRDDNATLKALHAADARLSEYRNRKPTEVGGSPRKQPSRKQTRK